MGKPVVAVLNFVLMAATAFAVDFLFLRNRFRERLLVNGASWRRSRSSTGSL